MTRGGKPTAWGSRPANDIIGNLWGRARAIGNNLPARQDLFDRLPYPLRPLAQTLDCQLSGLGTTGIDGKLARERIRRMPTQDVYDDALRGKGSKAQAALLKIGCYPFAGSLAAIVADWARAKPDNPLAHAAVRLICDRMLGPQPDAQSADREARRRLLSVHPDKVAHARMDGPLQRLAAKELNLLLNDLRVLLRDARFGRRVYAPGRMSYGMVSTTRTVLPAVLVGASIAACLALSPWLLPALATLGVLPAVRPRKDVGR